jgi:V/A-type H+-transporting ATPase subunit E
MTDKSSPEIVASGVEALIERLRDEGVAAGRARGDELIAEATQRARDLVQKAKDEATAIREQAHARAQDDERAGIAAVRAAMRDTVIELKNQLMRQFTEAVERLVSQELEKEDVVRRMILEVAGRAREALQDRGELEILLPRTVVDLEQVRRNPDEYSRGTLTEFVRQTAGELLRDGVTLATSEDVEVGVRVVTRDGGVEVDLGDEAITAALLEHLRPRFRAMLDGVVR